MKRGRKPDPVVQERIRSIADMLAAGVYVTRDTPRLLASKWGCSPKTVENYATRAAALVRVNIGDDDRLRTEMLAYLKRVTSICLKRGTEVHPELLPDGSPHPHAGELRERNAYQWFNTGIQAIDRLTSLSGIETPKRSEVKSEFTLEDLATLRRAMESNTCAPEPNQTKEPNSSGPPSLTSVPSAALRKSSRKAGGGKSSS